MKDYFEKLLKDAGLISIKVKGYHANISLHESVYVPEPIYTYTGTIEWLKDGCLLLRDHKRKNESNLIYYKNIVEITRCEEELYKRKDGRNETLIVEMITDSRKQIEDKLKYNSDYCEHCDGIHRHAKIKLEYAINAANDVLTQLQEKLNGLQGEQNEINET
jgi:hypothetical protein